MKKPLIAFFMLFLLSGCHQQKDVIYYIHHANQLESIISTCQMMGPLVASDPQCAEANNIYQQLVALSDELLSKPQQYGKTIISNQMQLSQLQAQIKQTSNPSSLLEQYNELKKQTDILIALAGQAYAPR